MPAGQTSEGHVSFIQDIVVKPLDCSKVPQESVVIFQIRAGRGLEKRKK